MEYRRLGDAGIRLSEIGLGGWLTFGNAVDIATTRAIFEKAFEVGVNFFDTANVYAAGRCEEQWGEVLADGSADGKAGGAGSRWPRSSYVLATKVFFPMGPGPNDRGLSRKHILEQCHASLRRLRTDYIDLYQCHRWDENAPLEETVRAMDDLVRQGKVLYWGFSQWSAEQIERCLKICSTGGYYAPRSAQPPYNLINRQFEATFPLCQKAGIGQVVYSPLAQGVLTGKYKPGQKPPADSRAADDRQNQFIKNLAGDAAVLAKVQRLAPIAEDHHVTLAQLALAWILRRGEVTSCIVGATKVRQLEQNAEASGVKLDDATVRRVEEIMA
jgi:aryl-alcohol dehydrogenase-like predicted oxidoreductase